MPRPAGHATGFFARKTNRAALAAALLAALAAAAISVDLPVARWMNERHLPGDLKRVIRLAEVFGFAGSVALIILAAATLDQRGWRVAPRLAAFAFGAGLLADFIKLFIARLRPSATPWDTATALDTFVAWLPYWNRESLPVAYGHAIQSFPSGHAATAVGLALGLTALYPRGRWLFAMLAVLACLQRIDAQAHFVSDVLAGAAVGCLVGACILRLPHDTPSKAADGEVR